MPEGPSIIILKEAAGKFSGENVITAAGNSKKIEIQKIPGNTLLKLKSFGKNFLMCFPDFTIRIHFMLYGSYSIDEEKSRPSRLSLYFSNGNIHFYACSVQMINGSPDDLYDWSADVMNPSWDPAKARQKLSEMPETMACDALLDQHIFAGVGNIIKNEVLFRIRVHPESKIGKMTEPKIDEMIYEAVNYSFEFLAWKKEFKLREHWLAHTKKICPRDLVPFQRGKLGKTKRRSFFCPLCQVLYE